MSIFKQTDRFDLEQAIMAMWGTKEDLELFYDNIEDMDLDEQWNTLLGLIQLVDMRCKKTFDIFEDLVHQGIFNNQQNNANDEDEFLKNLQRDFLDALDNEERGIIKDTHQSKSNPWDNTIPGINFG